MALSLLHCPVSYTKHGAPVGLLCLGEQAAAEKAARAAQGVLELLDQQLGSQAAPALGLLSNRRQVSRGLFFHITGHFLSDSLTIVLMLTGISCYRQKKKRERETLTLSLPITEGLSGPVLVYPNSRLRPRLRLGRRIQKGRSQGSPRVFQVRFSNLKYVS